MTLPVLFFDRPLPDEYRDLVEGRAEAVGPDDADLASADAVIAGAVRFWDASELAKAPKLKVLSRTGIGYDNISLADAVAAGVTVCNAPDAPTVSTAEHAVTLMMAVARRLPVEQARSRRGEAAPPTAGALELDGRVLGLVGLGRIARRVAAVGQALAMQVVAHDPFLETSPVPGVDLVDLATVLSTADVVSLHAPGTPETHHLVNAETLATMKRGVLIVNCARGSLVDQDALLAALDSGHVGGAGLDVTEPEPLPGDHPLLARDDVIVTAHIASSTAAGRRRLYDHGIANALAVLAGQPATIVAAPEGP